VAFVPAKGSSERIENKNAKLLDGRPLVVHMLDKLLKCQNVDEVYLDTESNEIAKLARHLPVKIMKRNRFLASNGTDGHALFMNEVRHTDADIYVQALCTAPFVRPETIDRAIDILTRDSDYDSVALVRNEKQYLWTHGEPAYGFGHIPNSVELPPTTIEAMSLYVVRRDAALATNRRFGAHVHLLETSPIESVDVNTPGDFELAEFIASGQRERERVILRTLRTELTSPVLADILDRLGVHGAVRGLRPLTPDARILGRANTLKLRALEPGEDFHGIYDALKSYERIVANDVIVVENGVPDFAYFGDLNARLAIRAGAVGAIIDGATRDSNNVRALGFPVFARGTFCVDVRNRATVDDMDGPVTIGGQRVEPGDLVFADADGMIVIAKRHERRVIELAMETISKESQISLDIALNVPATRILSVTGAF
jgi:regulator of RNase E activity RraA/molybdopterin-guanine dinucleotide biosynthesis protein A